MPEHETAPVGHSSIGDLLAAASDADYQHVLHLAPLVMEQSANYPDLRDLWLVLDAWCSAAHAVDDYALMDQIAGQMLRIARQADSTEYRIMALLVRSTAQRCTGEGKPALEAAFEALELSDQLPQGSPVFVRLYQVLMAALVESGDLAKAWTYHSHLADALPFVAQEQEQGKGYWTLGNLAFTVGETEQAVEYHQQAADKLTPAQDLLIWARFNRASAELRLQASLNDQATHDFIKRAQLAFTLVEAGDLDLVGLTVTQSRFLAAQHRPEQALEKLRQFTDEYGGERSYLVPLLRWWAELLERVNDPAGAQQKRVQATHLESEGS